MAILIQEPEFIHSCAERIRVEDFVFIDECIGKQLGTLINNSYFAKQRTVTRLHLNIYHKMLVSGICGIWRKLHVKSLDIEYMNKATCILDFWSKKIMRKKIATSINTTKLYSSEKKHSGYNPVTTINTGLKQSLNRSIRTFRRLLWTGGAYWI